MQLDPKSWHFAAFGTSVGAPNTCLCGDGQVTLNSAAFNADGSIRQKGGKFVADCPADGESFYYTVIDPTRDTFLLQADVTLRAMNPTPDGQEGFALLLRDTIGGSGSMLSNTVSAAGTKLPINGAEIKDVVGVRNYSGISFYEASGQNEITAVRAGFDPNGDGRGIRLAVGSVYRLRLEKTADRYISSAYAIGPDGTTGRCLGSHTQYIPAKDPARTSVRSYADLNDPMTVQEADAAYLGFAVARGVNASFSRIRFSVGAWNAADWHPQPAVFIDPVYEVTSAPVCGAAEYALTLRTNAAGTAAVSPGGAPVSVRPGENLLGRFALAEGENIFRITVTPDPDFIPGAFTRLRSHETAALVCTVIRRSFAGHSIHAAPDGCAANDGTASSPVDVQTALDFAAAGQTILLAEGAYRTDSLTVPRGHDGTETAPITLRPAGEGYVTFDFGGRGSGFTAAGDWWRFSRLHFTRSGGSGLTLCGSHILAEDCRTYQNGNTGLIITSLSFSDPRACWPAYNTVRRCTSVGNADPALTDADGFAAKLTVGPGNVFEDCLSAYNADDGFDLFAKVSTGSIGPVTIRRCVACRNGYLLASAAGSIPDALLVTRWDAPGSPARADGTAPLRLVHPALTVTDDGQLLLPDVLGGTVRVILASPGNGFKMGGSNLPGGHLLSASLAIENRCKGIDSNSCPDLRVRDSAACDNGGPNLALYTENPLLVTRCELSGVLSCRVDRPGPADRICPQGQDRAALCAGNRLDI